MRRRCALLLFVIALAAHAVAGPPAVPVRNSGLTVTPYVRAPAVGGRGAAARRQPELGQNIDPAAECEAGATAAGWPLALHARRGRTATGIGMGLHQSAG